ncbi:hypothetical protein GBAR_LOCUS18041 [Geodia barretti]|uniref:Uncharacterized protein n=1 Tax=Geodia barretti TaxID=519541 RepID=A0AA35SMH9_GEOBA|nr:hypothetical protein GBAR_LOCUS18041 [Geodia barretti]
MGVWLTVNIGRGKTWAGTVTEILYQQNPLDWALPIKRSRHQSPHCHQPGPSPPAANFVADQKLCKPRKKRKGKERAEQDSECDNGEKPCKKLKHEKLEKGRGGRKGKESGKLLKVHEKGEPITDTSPTKLPTRKADTLCEDKTLETASKGGRCSWLKMSLKIFIR